MEAGSLPPDGGLPDPMALSSEGLESGGVYVLEDGRDAYVYLDRDAAPGLVQVGTGLIIGVRMGCGGRTCLGAQNNTHPEPNNPQPTLPIQQLPTEPTP